MLHVIYFNYIPYRIIINLQCGCSPKITNAQTWINCWSTSKTAAIYTRTCVHISLITLVIPKRRTNAIEGPKPLSSKLLTSRHSGALRVHSLNSFSSPIHRPPFLHCSLISVLSGGPENQNEILPKKISARFRP